MIKLISIALCISIVLLSACRSKIKTESAFFHADISHSGYYNAAGVNQLHGVKWSYKTGGRVFSSPVICNDKVFIGSDDSSVYALNAIDGNLFWKFKTGGRVSSSAAVSNGKVFFISFDGYLYCLGEDSCELLWKFKTAGERVFSAPGIHGIPEKDRPLNDPWDMFLSSPVIADGKIYFGSGSGIFYALDCNSGKKVWEFSTNGVIHSSPAYSDSTVFFGSWDSYSGMAKSMDILYSLGSILSSPAISKCLIYFGSTDGSVYALN